MGWDQQEFMGPQGLQRLLQKLSLSPLVRRKLPNTASVMSQYFSFRRGAQESIATFLLKESLHFEEFKEALQLLKDERSGRPETFYIPEDDEEDDADEDEDSPKKEKAYEKVPTEDPDLMIHHLDLQFVQLDEKLVNPLRTWTASSWSSSVDGDC